MPTQPLDTQQTLHATIALNKESRRAALLRTARGEGLHLPEILSGIVVVLAVAMLYFDPTRAAYAAVIACLSIGSTCMTRVGRQMKAVCALLDMDKPS